MMALSLAHGLAPALIPDWLPGLGVWIASAMVLNDLNRFQAIQISLMCAVGIAGIAYASALGDFAWWPAFVAGNHPLIAMLAAVTFLRLVTVTGDPAEVLPRGPRAIRQTLLAAHLFGAVINISAPIIIGERIAAGGRLTPLQAKAISRPFVAAAMWSPFFAAMAIVLHYVPAVSLPVISGIGFGVAMVLLAFCAWTLPRDPDAAGFVGFPLHLAALRIPLILSVAVLTGHAALPGLSILTLVGVASLSVAASILLVQGAGDGLAALRAHVATRLPDMSGELTLFLAAAVMAAGIDAAVRASGVAVGIEVLDAHTAAILLAGLILLAVAGIHLVISISALASLWSFGSMDPNLLGAVFLLAWGLGLVISPFSGTTLALQGRFGLRSIDFVRWNCGYVVFGYVIAVAALELYAWLR